MATKISLSEKDLKELVGKQCEMEFARLSNDTFNKVTEKYEAMIKEQTTSEIDKVNDAIKQQCPVHGAIVFVLDRTEITVPFGEHSKIDICGFNKDLSEDKTLHLDYDMINDKTLLDVISFIAPYHVVKFTVNTGRDVYLYDKEAFDKDGKIVKEDKVYNTKYVSLIEPSKVTSAYFVNATLD